MTEPDIDKTSNISGLSGESGISIEDFLSNCLHSNEYLTCLIPAPDHQREKLKPNQINSANHSIYDFCSGVSIVLELQIQIGE